MKKNILLICTVISMVACNNVENKSLVPAFDLSNLDTTYLPSEDFYEYATHGWQTKNPMRPEFSRYGAFDVLRENNEIRLNDLFSEMTKMVAEQGSIEQKIIDLYKMGLDSVKRNEQGIQPAKKNVELIMSTTKDNLASILSKIHIESASPFFSIGAEADLANSSINALYLYQSGLGMGNKDYYLDPEHQTKRDAYIVYLSSIFEIAGIENSRSAAESVLAFETKMAEKFRSKVELRDIQANYNPTSTEDFLKTYDSFDWNTYFTGMGIKDIKKINLGQPEVLTATLDIIKNESIESIRYYLTAQYLSSAASYMNDEIYSAYFNFFGKIMSGQEEPKPLWKRAMSIPNSILSEAVGQMYVAKYFPKEDKARVLDIVKNLQTSLGEHIDSLDWMSAETKAKAHDKLDAFTVKIGYPDKWKDYSSLTINPEESYLDNIVAANIWYNNDNLSKLDKEVDREEWFMSPQTVNAYYNPTTNEICFPAAILQPPFYNPNADDAINYGAIGVVIGHEMTHGFDDQGRQFDKDGNLSNWWSEADAEAFTLKTEKLIAQFDSIEVLPGIHANGKLSLGENIADQGGLRISYTAFRNYIKNSGNVEPEPIDGFTADQRFYLGYAAVWAQNIRNEEIERLTKQDVHSLGKNRVNATLKNIDTFYKAFNITGGNMYIPEEERVIIW